MGKYLVSNIHGRKHALIYKELGQGAIFDLSERQDGWDLFSSIKVGDEVFVINPSRNIAVAFNVTKVIKGILLDSESDNASKIAALTGGDTGVIFGAIIRRVDQEYSAFVVKNNIKNSKLNPETGAMYQGFNCAKF